MENKLQLKYFTGIKTALEFMLNWWVKVIRRFKYHAEIFTHDR